MGLLALFACGDGGGCGGSYNVCQADATCAPAPGQARGCLCDAQLADDGAAVDARFGTFGGAGGGLAPAFIECMSTRCADCGF